MSLQKFLSVLAWVCVGLSHGLSAQSLDMGIRVGFTVSFQNAADVYVSFAGRSIEDLAANPSGGSPTWGARNGVIEYKTVVVQPNVRLPFTVSAWNYDLDWEGMPVPFPASARLDAAFTVPSGWEAVMEHAGDGFGNLISGSATWYVVVRRKGGCGTCVVGANPTLSFEEASLAWRLPMGELGNGENAGEVVLSGNSLHSQLSRADLDFASTSADVQRVPTTGTLRQIVLPHNLIDIIDVTGGFSVRVFPISQKGTFTGGAYQLLPGSIPTRTQTVKRDGTNRITFSHIEGSVTNTTAAERYTTGRWKIVSSVPGQHTIASGTNPNEEITEWFDGVNVIQRQVETFASYGVNPDGSPARRLMERRLGNTGSPHVWQFDYYPITDPESVRGRLRWEKSPGGGFVRYDYYQSGMNAGKLYREYRPFLNAPSLPTESVATLENQGRYTQYAYTDGYEGGDRLPSEVLEYTQGRLSGKTLYSYDFDTFRGTGQNGIRLQIVTKDSYSNASAFARTVTRSLIFADSTSSNPALHGKLDSVTHVDLSQTSYAYQLGTWNGTSFTDGGVGKAMREFEYNGFAASVGSGFLHSAVTGPNLPIEPIKMVAGISTVTERVRVAGNVVWEELSMVNSSNQIVRVQRTLREFTDDGRKKKEQRVSLDNSGAVIQTVDLWTGTYDSGRLVTEIDAAGTKSTHTYDAANRLIETKVHGHAGSPWNGHDFDRITKYAHDSANRLLSVTKVKHLEPSQTMVTSYSYDLAGDLTTESRPGGFITTYQVLPIAAGGLMRRSTTQLLITSEISTYRDGSVWKSEGTGVVASYRTAYAESGTGNLVETVTQVDTVSRPIQSRFDWTGKILAKAGYSGVDEFKDLELYTYDGVGRLVSIKPIVGSSVRFIYEPTAGKVTKYLDVNNNGYFDAAGMDRATLSTLNLVKLTKSDGNDDGWWRKSSETTFTVDSQATESIVSSSEERISGHTGSIIAQSAVIDAFGQRTITTESIDPVNMLRQVTQSHPAFYAAYTAMQQFRAGRLEVSRSFDAYVTHENYDHFGRAWARHDQRKGWSSSSFLNNSNQETELVYRVYTPNYHTYFDYDVDGRVVSEEDWSTDFANKMRTRRFAHNSRGQVVLAWGDGQTPTAYGYDNFGARTSMHMYRDGAVADWSNPHWPSGFNNPDTTNWTYHAHTGLLHRETDPSGQQVTYTYTADGKIETRQGSRGRIKAHAYDANTRDLLSVTDSTVNPAVAIATYTYDRRGLPKTVTDASGLRTFTHDSSGHRTKEELPSLLGSRKIETPKDNFGRRSDLRIKNGSVIEHEQTYSYRLDGGRINSITSSSPIVGRSGAQVSSYRWLTSSRLLEGVDQTWATIKREFVWQSNRDAISSTTIDATESERSVPERKLQITHLRDSLGRISVSTFWNEDHSLVAESKTRLFRDDDAFTSNSPNRGLTDGSWGVAYTYNQKSELTAEQYRKNITIAGVFMTVPVNTDALGNNRTRTTTYDQQGNPTAQAIHTTGPQVSNAVNQLNQLISHQGSALVYDDDGNLTSDGVWSYTYDSEDRLVKQERSLPSVIVIDHRYDYLGRRFEVKTTIGSVVTVKRFIHDGWSVVGEYEGGTPTSIGTLTETYAWGIDSSQTIGGAGGAGGLLLAYRGQRALIPLQDERGNIYGYRDSENGSTMAWDFSAHGDVVSVRGMITAGSLTITPEQIEFKHRSQYKDTHSPLTYYGFRFYDSRLGRFINRDPIGHAGGNNLYGMTGSDYANKTDILGLFFTIDRPALQSYYNARDQIIFLDPVTVRPNATDLGMQPDLVLISDGEIYKNFQEFIAWLRPQDSYRMYSAIMERRRLAARTSYYREELEFEKAASELKLVEVLNIEGNNTTPWQLGVEWLTGTGPIDHRFTNGDPMTEMLRRHSHIQDTRTMIANNIATGGDLKGRNDYQLGGLQGVPKYIVDYSTLLTGGRTGNLAVTYLGSYRLSYEVTGVNFANGTATVRFSVRNRSTISSGTRPPVIGYTEWWSQNIGDPLNQFFSSGPMSTTTQTLIWTEIIEWPPRN